MTIGCTLSSVFVSHRMVTTWKRSICSRTFSSPCILLAEREVKQYFIAVESNLYCEVHSLAKAFSALFAIYYVYDIAYPKQCSNSCLFIERFLFALKGPQQITQTAIGILASILIVLCSLVLLLFTLFGALLMYALKLRLMYTGSPCTGIQ